MSWWQFRYVFNKEIENAMRYSIHEAMRQECRSAGGGTTENIANNAIERFRAKMDKYAPAMTPREKIEHAIDHCEPAFIADLKSERETWIADNMRYEILTAVRALPR